MYLLGSIGSSVKGTKEDIELCNSIDWEMINIEMPNVDIVDVKVVSPTNNLVVELVDVLDEFTMKTNSQFSEVMSSKSYLSLQQGVHVFSFPIINIKV